MLDAIIFDKDGTLFDFRLSWGAFTHSLLAELAGDADQARRLGLVLGFDPDTATFTRTSPVISMTTPQIAAILHPHLTGITLHALNDRMNALSAAAPMVPAVPLRAVLSGFSSEALKPISTLI